MTIYEAEQGQAIHITAKEAIKYGCEKFTHNNRLYSIDIEYVEVAKISYPTGKDELM